MALLTVLVIVYVISVICRASFTQVKTITAKEATAFDAVTSDCWIIREETLIKGAGSGVISYSAGDGEKVSVNETVAGVFDSVASAGTKQECERLTKQIEALRLLQDNSDTLSKTPAELDKNVNDYLIRANAERNSGNLSGAQGFADDVLFAINERQLITGKTEDYSEKIRELETRLKQLQKELSAGKQSKEIKTPVAGYFVSSTDGYENAFDIANISKLMPDMLSDKTIRQQADSGVIGKCISGVYWYAACPVSAEDALKIKNAGSLQLDIPVVSGEKIDVELQSINQKSKSADAVVILKGTFMNSEMARLRKGKFSIILHTYRGIEVPKSAVHEQELTKKTEDENGKTKIEKKTCSGVYVKMGNEVTFREIVPLFTGENSVISSLNTQGKTFLKDNAVQVYDQIIVEGANLYAGKIIGRNA